MKTFILKKEMFIPVQVNEAWDFFSDPLNLRLITPPEMKFDILTKNLPAKIHSGLLIEYLVSPLPGMRTNWTTQIKDVNKPYSFTDEQLHGPYTLWRHTHHFSETAGGTMMKDEVLYSLPFSVFGWIAHALIVKKRLEYIFHYRSKVITQRFCDKNNSI